MKLDIAHTFSAPRDKVFAVLTDPAVMQRHIPGSEPFTPAGADEYEFKVNIRSSFFNTTYKGTFAVADKQPPDSFRLVITAKGMAGNADANLTIQLTGTDGATNLTGTADVKLTGMLGSIGDANVKHLAGKVLRELFTSLEKEF